MIQRKTLITLQFEILCTNLLLQISIQLLTFTLYSNAFYGEYVFTFSQKPSLWQKYFKVILRNLIFPSLNPGTHKKTIRLHAGELPNFILFPPVTKNAAEFLSHPLYVVGHITWFLPERMNRIAFHVYPTRIVL